MALRWRMIAHGSPTSAHSFVLFEGRRYPLSLEGRGWRLRSRSAKWPVDVLLGYGSRKWAEAEAKKRLREGALTKAKPCLGTLEELITAYKSMPKRAGVAAAAVAECRLRSCVRLVTGRELDAVKVSEINAAFWLRYTALRQGLQVADLSTRRVDGTAINAAMRQAASIFIPRLRPAFAALGFEIAPDASVIQWLPTIRTEKPNVGRNLIDDWRSLNCNVGRNSNDARGRTALWLAIGLARFAGLRRDEIEHATAAWIQADGAATYIQLRDRPEEGWLSKTGRRYRALVIEPELAQVLRACPPGYIVQPPAEDRRRWFVREPQQWLKAYTDARQPLHRQRGLYADDVARLTADAITARLEGVRAASEALGHTSTATTTRHYLSDAV